ncbi:hypothetical protein Tco_0797912 [Tanacetum coccineum]
MTTAGTRAVINIGKGKMDNALKKSRWVWKPKGNPEICLQDHAVVDSGCSIHMTGNKSYLSDYENYNRGFVAFGSDPKGEDMRLQALQDEEVARQVHLDALLAKRMQEEQEPSEQQ